MAKPKRAPAKLPPNVSIPREKYDRMRSGLTVALKLLADMESAGALRLPFNGYIEAVQALRVGLKK